MHTHTQHSRVGGGGGVAGMNAQKLIKDRVVCPAGAWCPGDLTALLFTPPSTPPLSYTSLPRPAPAVYKRRRERPRSMELVVWYGGVTRAVGLIDRPLFLPGRPQKLKTTTRETGDT